MRRLGSAAINCAWTALGRLDGYWEFRIKPWDIAAGGLLVREAGGRATSTKGDEEFMLTGTIVVSNGLLHEQILRVCAKGTPRLCRNSSPICTGRAPAVPEPNEA